MVARRREGSPSDPAVRAALEDSAEDLYEHAPCGYLSTLPDGTIVKVNETFLRWTGHAREQLVGRLRFQQLLTVGGRIYHETHYAPLLRMQGRVREIAVDIVRADGSHMPALVNSMIRYDDAGEPLAVRTTIFDATERRSYERELLRAREQAERSEERARLLAQTLQATFIPPSPPTVEGLDIAAVYRPAGDGSEVGGDFYDVFENSAGDWAITIGDVSGKGVGAATVTALARYALRAAAVRTRRPRAVLSALNTMLVHQQLERFCTVAYARLRVGDARGPTLTVSSGGHPLPLLVDARGDARTVGRPGTLIGAVEEPVLHDKSTTLSAGDVVVFYTDGVTEARDGPRFFGEDRLCEVLVRVRAERAGAIATEIVDEVIRFGGASPRDDIALVVLKVPTS